MSKGNTFETQLLLALFESTTLAAIGTISLGANLYVSVHTADPGETGTAITNEANFTGYARVAMERSSSVWTVTDDTVVSDVDCTFPLCTGGDNDITHFAIVNTSSGAGTVLYKGTIKESGTDTTRSITNGIQLILPAGDISVSED